MLCGGDGHGARNRRRLVSVQVPAVYDAAVNDDRKQPLDPPRLVVVIDAAASCGLEPTGEGLVATAESHDADRQEQAHDNAGEDQ